MYGYCFPRKMNTKLSCFLVYSYVRVLATSNLKLYGNDLLIRMLFLLLLINLTHVGNIFIVTSSVYSVDSDHSSDNDPHVQLVKIKTV